MSPCASTKSWDTCAGVVLTTYPMHTATTPRTLKRQRLSSCVLRPRPDFATSRRKTSQTPLTTGPVSDTMVDVYRYLSTVREDGDRQAVYQQSLMFLTAVSMFLLACGPVYLAEPPPQFDDYFDSVPTPDAATQLAADLTRWAWPRVGPNRFGTHESLKRLTADSSTVVRTRDLSTVGTRSFPFLDDH